MIGILERKKGRKRIQYGGLTHMMFAKLSDISIPLVRFYSSSPPGEPSNLHLYRIAVPGGGPNSTLVQGRKEIRMGDMVARWL